MATTDDSSAALFDRDPTLTASYEHVPRWFIPGYDLSHALAAVLLRERLGERARILVVGAGGGVELSVFAKECAGWSFVGVDPSRVMLEQARRKLALASAAERVQLVEGSADAAPRERFDAATAFLCLNFVPDDGSRLAALREIHARLAPGGTFLVVDGCNATAGPRFEEHLRLYAAFGRRNGAPPEAVERGLQMQREGLFVVPPAREEQLLAEAGFRDFRLFYSALWIHGWSAIA
jgi:tRNA (cmo5U34)-methyltransferase